MIVDFLSRIITILNFTQLHLRQTRYSINSSKSKTSITPDQRKIELLQKGEVKVPFLTSVYRQVNGQCLVPLLEIGSKCLLQQHLLILLKTKKQIKRHFHVLCGSAA